MHRTATFFDLKISARGVSGVKGEEDNFVTDPKPLHELFGYVETLFNGGDRLLKKGRIDTSPRIYLSDMRFEDGRLILLVNRSDPTAPDAVSTDPENKSRVVHEKPKGHGGDYSAHVVINLTPVAGENYYLCVVETVYGSGLHATSMVEYLRYVIRQCKIHFKDEFKLPHSSGAKRPRGKPIMVHWMHEVELQGHPSEEFEQDLEEGSLTGIELLSFSQEGVVWDDKGGVVERARTVQLRPQPDMLGNVASAVRQVRNKVQKAGYDYKHIRIRFKNQGGEPKDATISTDSGKLIDSNKYVKRHTISAPMVNTNSVEKISSFIIKEVIELMG